MHIATILAGYSREQEDVITTASRPRSPGSITDEARAEVYARPASSHCHYCHAPLTPRSPGQRNKIGTVGGCGLTLDHLVARSLGGTGEAWNLVTACAACNERKGVQPLEVFLASGWLRGRRKVVARALSCDPEHRVG